MSTKSVFAQERLEKCERINGFVLNVLDNGEAMVLRGREAGSTVGRF